MGRKFASEDGKRGEGFWNIKLCIMTRVAALHHFPQAALLTT
jgi:hypothetical protein